MIKIKQDNDLFMGIKAVWRLKDLVKAVIYMLIFVFFVAKGITKNWMKYDLGKEFYKRNKKQNLLLLKKI